MHGKVALPCQARVSGKRGLAAFLAGSLVGEQLGTERTIAVVGQLLVRLMRRMPLEPWQRSVGLLENRENARSRNGLYRKKQRGMQYICNFYSFAAISPSS